MCKYVIVTGSVCSSVGKGISAASINLLMKMRNIKTEMIKYEPYYNFSASNLDPYQHGNVVVLSDGRECDLDMTHYYSLGQADLSSKNICTSGQIYSELFQDEMNGKWHGATIQERHIRKSIQKRLIDLGKDCDLVICELGGTCSDQEASVYYSAIREFKQIYKEDVLIVHVSLILYLNTVKEFKTKPLQRGIGDLRSFGLEPDLLLCRCDRETPEKILDKVSELTGISRNIVFSCPDAECIYQVPLMFYNKGIDDVIVDKLRLKRSGVRISKYRDLVEKYVSKTLPEINIGILGKYASSPDSYLTVKEAVVHAAISCDHRVNFTWIDAESIEDVESDKTKDIFKDLHGVVFPGGFGKRHIENTICGIEICREKKLPCLFICLGHQLAVVEYARNVLKWEDANSLEFNSKTNKPVVVYVQGQEKLEKKSGTLRLGAYDCELNQDSISYKLFGKKLISEIHRHRLEVNSEYVEDFKKAGFNVAGTNPQTGLIEIMELDKNINPFYVCTQFHPEYASRIGSPSPFFCGLVAEAVKYKDKTNDIN